MTLPDRKTLLASLLSLHDLQVPIAPGENQAFRGIAEQLVLGFDKWQLIEPDLFRIVKKNPQLDLLFQNYRSRLEQIDSDTLLDLLPTEADLESVVPLAQAGSPFREKGPKPVQSSEPKNDEIVNIAIRVMAAPDPAAATKKLSQFEQIKQILS